MEEIKNKFVGKWKLDRSENFDSFLREIGVNFVLRKLASAASPVVTISIDDDGKIHINTNAGFRTTAEEFKLDEEFEKETEGQNLKAKFTMDDNKLKLYQEPVDSSSKLKPQTVYREIVGDELLMTIYIGDVVCKRWFKRMQN